MNKTPLAMILGTFVVWVCLLTLIIIVVAIAYDSVAIGYYSLISVYTDKTKED